jgi:hypothetical protein
MALRLAREEPEGGPWRAEPLTVVIEALTRLGSGRARSGRGSILVPAGCPVLIIEGVGAGRSEVSGLIDALVWVQADQQEAERRSLARIGQPGGPRTVGDYREWMAEEDPFVAGERTWQRADMLVAGTPQIRLHPASDVAVAPPLSA